jgi:hypothetical protein
MTVIRDLTLAQVARHTIAEVSVPVENLEVG